MWASEGENTYFRVALKLANIQCNYQVLIIDEWLNYKVDENGAKVLYEIFDGRCEKRPTVFVGQYPQDEWYERLGGGAQSESILDRIVYNAYTIQTGETNLRRIYETRKLNKLMTEMAKGKTSLSK